MRRKILATAVMAMALVGLMSGAALADSPHFIRASGSLNNDGSLTVNFKEAGLGTNQLINYTLSADATATYVCVNRGGANPTPRTRPRSRARQRVRHVQLRQERSGDGVADG